MCAITTYDSQTSGSVYKCNRCGYVWVTRKLSGLPRSCPKCRSVIWNKDCNFVHCLRCGHEWVSTSARPVRCPGCHSSRWDAPVEKVVPRRTPRAPADPAVAEQVRRLTEQGRSAFDVARELDISYQMVREILDSGSTDRRLPSSFSAGTDYL